MIIKHLYAEPIQRVARRFGRIHAKVEAARAWVRLTSAAAAYSLCPKENQCGCVRKATPMLECAFRRRKETTTHGNNPWRPTDNQNPSFGQLILIYIYLFVFAFCFCLDFFKCLRRRSLVMTSSLLDMFEPFLWVMEISRLVLRITKRRNPSKCRMKETLQRLVAALDLDHFSSFDF